MDAARGSFAWIPGMEHLAHPPSILSSPTRPVGVAIFDNSPEPQPGVPMTGDFSYWMLDAAGHVPRRQHSIRSWVAENIVWGVDGSRWYVQYQNRKTKKLVTEEMNDAGVGVPADVAIYSEPRSRPRNCGCMTNR